MENQTGIGTGNLNYTEASIQEYKEGVGLFQEVMPDVVNGYNDFTGACFKEGTVSEKDKQLIATGISVYSRDEYCIMYHTKMALEKGATPEEIMESVAVASALGGGTAFSQGVTLVMDVLQQYQNQIH
ncbi:MAG: carboxymuconolactone decarboxylase family protein [Bacillaceae bacterium]|nr:carboxymuconolactone decarboxylase family protein [Bacillaceae bacterium]